MALRGAVVMDTRILEVLGAGKGDPVVLLGPQSSVTQMHSYSSHGLDAELFPTHHRNPEPCHDVPHLL